MDDISNDDPEPAGWLGVLAESDVDLAAGRIVPGTVVLKDLLDSLARLGAKTTDSAGDAVRHKLEALGITETDVGDAVAAARHPR